jgi:hypothetical protein
MRTSLYVVVLLLNTVWFGAAFHYFSLRQYSAAMVLVPHTSRDSPLFQMAAASVRFLGGMNLAFAVLSLLLLLNLAAFPGNGQRALLLLTFCIAHGSQFYFNVPIAVSGGRKGEALWDVLQGPMRFIFIVDAVLMLTNGELVVVHFAVQSELVVGS